ncbi:MAG: NAD(P)/FAD-dependent oxidoreductase [Candidatus Tyrphobacter sp.]
MKTRQYDVIVVGGGPARLNAALVLGRARRSVLVCDDGTPRNAAAQRMHGFITRDGAEIRHFSEIAIEEIARYQTVEVRSARVVSARDTASGFTITTASGEAVRGKRLLLTTGVVDELPKIDGLAERWGKSVFVCPFCDGWEFQNRRCAVYGAGSEAVSLAMELYGWTHDIVVCPERDTLTSRERAWIAGSGVGLKFGQLRRLIGSGTALERAEFADGEDVSCEVLFISAPLRQHSALFGALDCALTDRQAIAVNDNNETSHRGCYAAGDAVTSVHQVIVAAASGVRAAIAITNDLLELDAERLILPHSTRYGTRLSYQPSRYERGAEETGCGGLVQIIDVE